MGYNSSAISRMSLYSFSLRYMSEVFILSKYGFTFVIKFFLFALKSIPELPMMLILLTRATFLARLSSNKSLSAPIFYIMPSQKAHRVRLMSQ